MKYNWQQKDWCEFKYDLSHISDIIEKLAQKMSRMSGIIEALPEKTHLETMIDFLVTEAIKTSEIEGEFINRDDVMSSIRNQLSLNEKPIFIKDKRAKNVSSLMLAIRNDYASPLTEDMLFSWHKILMEGNNHIQIGAWRTHEDAMQIISNISYNPKIHFEAPPSKDIPKEMKKFINWFNQSKYGQTQEFKNPIIHSAIAHLYFESIHPFEDGNGRIGRAISEKALLQGMKHPLFLSISKAIEQKKKDYYKALEEAQKSNNITQWIEYFVNMIVDAQEDAQTVVHFVLQKTKFFEKHNNSLEETHRKVINRMLAEGHKGFEGGMSAKKYEIIAKVSKATATRHLQYLHNIGVFTQEGAGRNTKYILNL